MRNESKKGDGMRYVENFDGGMGGEISSAGAVWPIQAGC